MGGLVADGGLFVQVLTVRARPGCAMNLDIQIDGTRTANTYDVVTTTSISYGGAACPLSPQRFIGHVHGMRTDPEPTEFCRSEEHTSELQSLRHLVCRLLLEKKNKKKKQTKRTIRTQLQEL